MMISKMSGMSRSKKALAAGIAALAILTGSSYYVSQKQEEMNKDIDDPHTHVVHQADDIHDTVHELYWQTKREIEDPRTYDGGLRNHDMDIIIGDITFRKDQYVRHAEIIPFTMIYKRQDPPNDLYMTYVITEDVNYFIPMQGKELNDIEWKPYNGSQVFQGSIDTMDMILRGQEGKSKTSEGRCVDLYVVGFDPDLRAAAVGNFKGDVNKHIRDLFSTQKTEAYVSEPICLYEDIQGSMNRLRVGRY